MQLWCELAEAEKAVAIAKILPRQRIRSSFLYMNIDEECYCVDSIVPKSYSTADL